MTDSRSSPGSVELADKLAATPLDQMHSEWPTIVPVRLSETERELIVNILRAYVPDAAATPSGPAVETAFLNLCEVLGLQATPATYLDAASARTALCTGGAAQATRDVPFMAQEILDFLNSIEGAGYGGMASFEIVRGYAKDLALSSTNRGGGA